MNLKTALETIKAVIAKVYKDKAYLKEVLDCYLNTLKQSVSKEDPTIEIDILETSRLKELRDLSNNQTSANEGFTRSPIFVVQDLVYVARVDEDIYEESSGLEGEELYRYEYFLDEGYRTAKQAIEDIEELLKEEDEELKEELLTVIEIYPNYKTDSHDLKEVWEVFPDSNGYGLCKYMYIDQTWFLTLKEAKIHIERNKHNYNKPRLYVKSLIGTDFKTLLKDLGFKHYE